MVWAALTAAICGLFSAALATRAAWETARPLPAPTQTRALLTELFPEHPIGEASSAPALFLYYGQPLSWSAVPEVIWPDGGEYEQASVSAEALGSPPVEPRAIVERTLHRLEQAGWLVYEPQVHTHPVNCMTASCDPGTPETETVLVARRGASRTSTPRTR